jgi:hypothetical protein
MSHHGGVLLDVEDAVRLRDSPHDAVRDGRASRTAVRDENGNTQTVPSVNHGKGSRWRARYVDDQGREHVKGFARKTDAQHWLNKQVSDQVTGTWTDPKQDGGADAGPLRPFVPRRFGPDCGRFRRRG